MITATNNFTVTARAYPAVEPASASILETDSKEEAAPAASPSDPFISSGYRVSSKAELFKRIDNPHIQEIIARIQPISLIMNATIEALKLGPYHRRSSSLFTYSNFFDYALKAYLTGEITEKRFHTLALYYGCLEAINVDKDADITCDVECYQLLDEGDEEQTKTATEILFESFFKPLGIKLSETFLKTLQEENPLDTQFFVLTRPPNFGDVLYDVLIKLAIDDPTTQWRWVGALPENHAQVVLPPHLINLIFKEKFGNKTLPLTPCFGFNPCEVLSKGSRPFYLPSPSNVGGFTLPKKIDCAPFKIQLSATQHDLYHAIIDAANFHLQTWIQIALYANKKTDLFPNQILRTELFQALLDRECDIYVSSQNDRCFAFWQTVCSMIQRLNLRTKNQIKQEELIQLFVSFYIAHNLHQSPDFAIDNPDLLTHLIDFAHTPNESRKIVSAIWQMIKEQSEPAS